MRPNPLLPLIVAGAGKLPARGPGARGAWMDLRVRRQADSLVVHNPAGARPVWILLVAAIILLVASALGLWMLLR